MCALPDLPAAPCRPLRLLENPGHHRRWTRRPDGRRSRASGRRGSRSLRRQGLGRAQVPHRRQGRPQPDPRRAPARLSMRVTAHGSREVGRWLDDFDADALREWARGFGIETYIGTSGRVFPMDRKAAPLLRGWVRRLRDQGVRFHVQHRWLGWSDNGALRFATPDGEREVRADATVLALGGGSWPELGSDGAWAPWLQERGIDVAPLQPSNCGFDIGWSEHFAASPCRGAAEAGDRPLARPRRSRTRAAGRMRHHRHRHRRQPGLCAVGDVARHDRARRQRHAATGPRPGSRPDTPAAATWPSRVPAAASANTCAGKPDSRA